MVKPALSSSSETMTTGGTYDKQLRRGNKRRQSSSSDSGSDDSGTLLEGVPEIKKPSSRPVSPKAARETLGDEITRTMPEAGWPGSTSQRKAEIEPDSKKAPPSPLALNDPVNIRGKEPCKCAKCKCRHARSSDILRNHLKRYPHDVLVGGHDAARGKRKEIPKKYHGSNTSMSAGNSLTARERKRVKTVLKGSATDDSFDTMLMKVEEVSSKMTKSPNDAGQSSKHSSGHNSNQNSQQTKSVDDSRSMNSRTTCSGKSSRKSSGRSSARSMESMDGHTELLESLVHAAHAEDKLHREKETLQEELKQLQRRNDELEQELLYTRKVVDKLRTKYKFASRDQYEMERKFHSEKAKWEKELQAILKREQIALNKDKSAPLQKH